LTDGNDFNQQFRYVAMKRQATPGMNNKGVWEHFHHGADIGVRGIGGTLEEAFAQAAKAMTAVVTDLDKVSAKKIISVTVRAADKEFLFYDWLNALIYEMAVSGMLFCDFRIKIANNILEAEVFGETVNREKHQPAVEIKGATFTELSVTQRSDNSWVAQCIVDV
jgi:tRNA nucleotidyltransferase (CCA-adding enzyme)